MKKVASWRNAGLRQLSPTVFQHMPRCYEITMTWICHTVYPVSSYSSRFAASSTVSPLSTNPAGISRISAFRGGRNCETSTSSLLPRAADFNIVQRATPSCHIYFIRRTTCFTFLLASRDTHTHTHSSPN